MSGPVVVLRGNSDVTSDLFVAACERLDLPVLDVDLRVDRCSVEVTRRGASVRINAKTVEPSVVFNRTGINGLGLSSADGLARQRSTSWRNRHTEGREEQGVMLAVFEAWQTSGVRLLNNPRATDLTLMPNAVGDRVRLAGGRCQPTPQRPGDVSVLICGGVGIKANGDAGGDHLELARLVADAAQFDFGCVRISGRDRLTATGWSPIPLLEEWDEPELLALAIVSQACGIDVDAIHPPSARYFVSDLGI